MGKPALKKAPAPVKTVEIVDCEQKSAEWFEARLGLATASNFGTIMAEGKDGAASKTRGELMRKLAGERLSGQPAESFKNKAMERGNEMEAEARDYYARTSFAELTPVGFMRRKLPNGDIIGCSPDSLVGADGALEVKTLAPHLMIEQMLRGTLPPEHRPQLHGTLWVGELEWVDLLLFYRGMPVAPKFRVVRDEVYIREIAERVEVFNYDVRKLVERIRNMSGRTARGTP